MKTSKTFLSWVTLFLIIKYNNCINISVNLFGLYSLCGANTSNISRATEFNHKAVSIHLGVLYGLNEENSDKRYNYTYYDVCNDQGILLSHLEDIILDPTYQQNSTSDVIQTTCIFSYMTRSLTKLAVQILTATEIPIISFNNNNMLAENQISSNYLWYGEPQLKTPQYYHSLLQRYGYDFVTVISLNQHYGTHTTYTQLKKINTKYMCGIYESLLVPNISKSMFNFNFNLSNFKKFTQKILRKKSLQIILIMSDIPRIVTSINHLFEIYIQTGNTLPHIKAVYEVHKNGTYQRKATKKILEQFKDRNGYLFGHNLNITIGDYEYSYILVAFEEIFLYMKNINGSNSKKLAKSILKEIKPKVLPYQKYATNCTNFKCGPGFERKIKKINDTEWQNKYSFVCMKCKRNFIKTTSDESQCMPCINKNISHPENTVCIVPYLVKKFDFRSFENVFAFLLNSTGLLFSIITFVLFEVNRKTPIVRASDTKLSELQLVSAISLFIFMLISVLMKITKVLCVAKPLCFGFLFTLFVAVTLAKAEKPLTVFTGNKKLTKKDITVTEAHQYLIIIILPLISVLLFIVSVQMKPVKVNVIVNNNSLTKIFYCNSDPHIHVQLGLLFVILLACLVQAFRSRKLPNNYSEAMVMLHSTFASCVCLLILIPIYLSQHDVFHRTYVVWIVSCTVALILVLAMYAPKVLIIVFYPEKNTVRSFRSKSITTSFSQTRSVNLDDDLQTNDNKKAKESLLSKET